MVSWLLEWLAWGEEVGALVVGFVKPVLLRGGDPDPLLARYVQESLPADQDLCWGEWTEAIWEDKLHAVCMAVTDEQVSAARRLHGCH